MLEKRYDKFEVFELEQLAMVVVSVGGVFEVSVPD
jgi:hypothetical protein